MIIAEGTLLYHGSYAAVERPDLARCEPGKDFGQGFYVTTDPEQARRFIRTSVRKAVRRGIITGTTLKGFVSVYSYHEMPEIETKEFQKADRDWLHCVVAHRRVASFPQIVKQYDKFDIIRGKVANDRTNPTITIYMGGGYGEVMTAAADETAIRILEPFNLTDQVCFRTERSLQCLRFLKVEEVEYGSL